MGRNEARPLPHENDVELAPLPKEEDKLMMCITGGGMAAILSRMEIMYVFIRHGMYQCFIHPLEAEEGRYKSWEINERNTAMIKNLTSVADQLFEIKYKPEMNYMGVMVAAERGIIRYLDITGQLPAEDVDFMAPLENKEDS